MLKAHPKTPIITQEIIAAMVQRIVERFDPEKIVLFGSCARGEITYDSDVDLLVVMPVEGSRKELIWAIDESMSDISVPRDIIVKTPEEVERFKDIVGTIIKPALQEGRVLYERRQ